MSEKMKTLYRRLRFRLIEWRWERINRKHSRAFMKFYGAIKRPKDTPSEEEK